MKYISHSFSTPLYICTKSRETRQVLIQNFLLSITLGVQAQLGASTPLAVCLQQHISMSLLYASPYSPASHYISSSVLCSTSVTHNVTPQPKAFPCLPTSPRTKSKLLKALCLSDLLPYCFLLAHGIPATLASLAFLLQTKHISPPGPLHLLFPSGHTFSAVPCMLLHFLQVSAQTPSQISFL